MMQERRLKDSGNDRQYASVISELKKRPMSIFNKDHHHQVLRSIQFLLYFKYGRFHFITHTLFNLQLIMISAL